eukprot:1696104-Amphidinium_carterae.1
MSLRTRPVEYFPGLLLMEHTIPRTVPQKLERCDFQLCCIYLVGSRIHFAKNFRANNTNKQREMNMGCLQEVLDSD